MSARFDLIRPYLDPYKRRFTVLDIGAGINEPTIGSEILAAGYDAVIVEIEQDWKPVPMLPGQIVLKKHFSIEDLVRLGECEHFDIVLAFNVAHWFDDPVEAVTVIADLGREVFIQIPSYIPAESEAPHIEQMPFVANHLDAIGKRIGETSQFPGHPPRTIWRTDISDSLITRSNWDAHDNSTDVEVIERGLSFATVFNHRKTPPTIGTWIPGINLWTFCRAGGVYPESDVTVSWVRDYVLPEREHGDVCPWNFIFDGRQLYLIDGFENHVGHASDREALDRAVARVEKELGL